MLVIGFALGFLLCGKSEAVYGASIVPPTRPLSKCWWRVRRSVDEWMATLMGSETRVESWALWLSQHRVSYTGEITSTARPLVFDQVLPA